MTPIIYKKKKRKKEKGPTLLGYEKEKFLDRRCLIYLLDWVMHHMVLTLLLIMRNNAPKFFFFDSFNYLIFFFPNNIGGLFESDVIKFFLS